MPAAIFATSLWLPSDGWTATITPMMPWFICRDSAGYWCVQRHGAWSVVVRLTGATSLPDDRLEEHARDVADALNRVYAANPFPR